MDFSLYEALSWVLQKDQRVLAEPSASKLLLCSYLIVYFFNKRPFYLVAFLLVEFCGNSIVFRGLSSAEYYLGYAFLYSSFYWVVLIRYQSVKTSFGYGTLVLFEGMVFLDAVIYPDNETLIYTYYTDVVVFLHLCVISSLIDWRLLRTRLGAVISALGLIMGINYNTAFFWYNRIKDYKTR